MRRVTMPLAMAFVGVLMVGCGEQDQPAMEDTEPAMEEAPAETMEATTFADFAGTWDAYAYMESGDTVPHTLIATSSADGWMIDLPERDPMAMDVTLVGDSVVSEIGPYESVLREGVMVTVRSVTHLEGDELVGTMTATYQDDEGETVVNGTVRGTRGM